MKSKGNIFFLLLIIIACLAFWFEYYVSGGKPFAGASSTKTDRPYRTFEEHLAQKEREKRIEELKRKITNLFPRN